MFRMKDGKIYSSDYCINHYQLEKNFKGLKKNVVTGELTEEFKNHMAKVKLDVVTDNGVKKAICPKCSQSFEIL